jgi:hypothetical protein
MKTLSLHIILAVLVGATPIAASAQLTTQQSDSVVAAVADALGLPFVPPDERPLFGTFWGVRNSPPWVTPPLPCPPFDPSAPVYHIGGEQYLIDETADEALRPAGATAASIIQAQADEVQNFVVQVQTRLAAAELRASGQTESLTSEFPPPPGGGGGTNEWGGGSGYSPPVYTTNDLWLEVISMSVTNETADLRIHPPWNVSNGVYDLFSTTNLAPAWWEWVRRTAPGETNITITNMPLAVEFFVLGITNDADGGGVSDAYEGLLGLNTAEANDDYINPVVGISVVDSVANEQQYTNTASFTLSRLGGHMQWPLVVPIQLSGSGTQGVNYSLSPVTVTSSNVMVTIPTNARSVTITLTPMEDHVADGTKTATLTIQSGSGWSVDTGRSSATAWIFEQYTDVYTSVPDFKCGVLDGLEAVDTNDGGHLQFKTNLPPQFPFINVACSARGTVARINTTNGVVIGEYRTAPWREDKSVGYADPSRTTVDQYGNVWVANRQDTQPINGTNYGSITRIGLILGPRYSKTNGVYSPNPNGQYISITNASYNTCIDRDGDGYIRTSVGLADILPWSNVRNGVYGVDTEGGVSTAEDEAITEYLRVPCTGTRTIAVDKFNDIWVGGHDGTRIHLKVNGLTGEPVPRSAFAANAGGYGGVIDALGNLWSSDDTFGAPMWLRPPTTLPVQTTNWQVLQASVYGYGIAVDPLYPRIWQTYYGDVFCWNTNGTPVTNANGNVILYSHHYPNSQGLTVDTNGHVWVAQSAGATTVAHLDTNGVWLGNVSLRLSGLRAEFYANTNLDGVPVFVRADGPIDFNWGTNSPATGVPATNYSVKWSGVLHTRTAGDYVLIVTTDTGAGFYLSGNSFTLDNWNSWVFDPSVTQLRTTNNLSADTDYTIELRYRKGTAPSHVQLSWIEPGSGNEVVIPHSQLRGPQVGEHPTGVSVDSFGKIWAANMDTSSAMRIDPNAGDMIVTNGVTNYVGAADMYVDLGDGSGHPSPYNVAAAPYNYSDMTGFNNRVVNPGLKPLKGYWSVINDSGLPGEIWNRVSWNAFLTNGCSIEVYVRASDSRATLGSETFAFITNGAALAGIEGQFIEVRLAITRDDANKQPMLYDLTLNGTSSGFAGSGLMEDYAAFETDDAYFYADVIGPEPMTYQWFVQYPWTNQWTFLPAVTGPELVLTNVDQWDDGTLFKVLASNGNGESLWLSPAELWVFPLSIIIPSYGPAARYPATINVRGEPSSLGSVEVALYSLTHYHPDDLDVLLISPSGKKIMLMSQAGGYTSVTNTTLVFHPASQGHGQIPYQDPIPSGTTKDYSPANYGDPSQLPGAPAGPYNATVDQLTGDNPNGIWKLYIYDHAHNNGGVLDDSWGLNFSY